MPNPQVNDEASSLSDTVDTVFIINLYKFKKASQKKNINAMKSYKIYSYHFWHRKTIARRLIETGRAN